MQTRKSLKSGVSFAALLSLALLKSQAQTTATWTGPASGGEWNTAASWSTLAAPGTDANQVTNVFVGPSTNISYNLPMVATGFGTLTSYGVVNVNTNGFNTTGVLMLKPAGGDKLYVNAGGVMNVTGNLALCSNAVANVAGGGALNISGSLYIGSGATGGSSGGGVSSYGIMTNSGGILTAAATSLNIGNGSVTTSPLLVITGGTNNLGNVIVKRSNAGSGGYSTLGSEGLMIYGGLVNMTNLNVGGGNANSFLTTLITGGIVTNYGSVTINQGSAARGSRILQTGGLFVVPDPGVVNPNPTVTSSLNVYSVTGGTNLVGGFYFGNSNLTSAGTVNFTNAAAIYVGSQGIASNGVAAVTAVLNSGGLFGATAAWTSSVPFRLTSGTFTFLAADPAGSANSITLTGPLSGAGSLAKTGNGTLTMGAANTYAGNTFIGAGTLAVAAGGSLTSPNILVNSGATLDVSQVSGFALNTSQILAGSGTVNGAVTTSASAVVYPGSNAVTGTLTLQGSLTETGGAVNEFNLAANPAGAGNDFLSVAGALNLSGTNTILLNGALTAGAVYPLIQYGSLTGDVTNLAVVGATGVLSNSVAAQRIYFIALATLRGPANTVWVGNNSANNWDVEVTTNWLNAGALDYFVSGDNVQFNNAGGTNSTINLAGTVTPGSITVNITTSSNYTFTGTGLIGGVGSLTVSNGLLTVLTTNTYTGPTVLAGGVLATPNLANSGNPSGLGAATADPNNLVFNGGTLDYFGGSTGIDHGILLTNAGGTLDVTNGTTLTLNGVLYGNGGLTKIDTGTLVLTAGNAYTGNTTVSNGVLALNTATAASSGTLALAGGTVSLTTGGQTTYANNLTVTANSTINSAGGNNNILGGTWTGSSNVTLNVTIASGGTFSVNGSLTNFLGTIELGNDAGFFRFNAGGGNTTFGAPNAVIDVGTNTATLEARNPGTIAVGTLFGASGTFVKGPSSTAGTLVWQIGSNTNNPNSVYYGTIANSAANEIGSVSKVGGGTLTLAGQSTYTGQTVINTGTLALTNNPGTGNDGSINNSATINLVAGAVLDVSGRSDGTFQLGGSATQLLEGRGTINGQLNVGGSGTVAPGGGQGGNTGTLTVTNSVTLNGTVWLKLNRANTPNSDQLVSSLGGITYGGTLVVTNIGSALQIGDTFTLFSGSGLGAGTFGSVVLPSYYTFDTSNLGVNGTVTVTGTYKPALTKVDFSFLASGYLTFNAVNGAPNGGFAILTSTNAALPLSQWTSIATGTFDGSGNLSNQYVTVDPSLPQAYYVLQAQ